MTTPLATGDALEKLANGEFATLCLVKPRDFAVLVRFDHRTGEFVFGTPWKLTSPGNRPRPWVSMVDILFQTEPYPYPRSSDR